MKQKRRLITSGIALAMVAVLALTGTLAWQSISQRALGEKQSPVNPGGRLHDDFDGTNRDIYVENFSDEVIGAKIFARVRLDEYMETGVDAGLKNPKTQGGSTKKAESVLGEGVGDIDDLSTWRTRTPAINSNADDPIAKFWGWDLNGGSTWYMPTFNMNKDSLAADINGTYDGKFKDDDKHYDDYVAWKEKDTKTGDEIYDADTNDFDEGEGAVEDVNITVKKNVTHTAAETKTSTPVITMETWKTLEDDEKTGDFWVWDEDGWFYWANPIAPQETTGLLLSGVTMQNSKDLTDRWYYGVNAVAQFVTKDDLGNEDEDTGFYNTKQGSAPTGDAILLLQTIGGATQVDELEVTADDEVTMYIPGDTLPLTATGSKNGKTVPGLDIEWAVAAKGDTATQAANADAGIATQAVQTGTAIDKDGYLTVAANETETLVVTATVKGPGGGQSSSVELTKASIGIGMTEKDSKTEYTPSGTASFTAEATTAETGEKLNDATFAWSVMGATDEGTKIDAQTGALTVGADERGDLVIKAKITSSAGQGLSRHYRLPSAAKRIIQEIKAIDIGSNPGSTTTVTVDGIEWYVLAEDKTENRALLLSKDALTNTVSMADPNTTTKNNPQFWDDGILRPHLNGTWLNERLMVKQRAIETTIYTPHDLTCTEVVSSQDKVFLLSEADVNGTFNGNPTTDSRLYIYNSQLTAPGKSNWSAGVNSFWSLRTLKRSLMGIALVNTSGSITNGNSIVEEYIRPAFWFDLSE